MKKFLFIILTAIISFAQVNPFEDVFSKINNTDTQTEEINETNTTKENNNSLITYEEFFSDIFESEKPKITLAVIIDKKKFFKFVPSVINSINAYLIYKNVDFNLSVFSTEDNITKIQKEYKNIIYIGDKNFPDIKIYNPVYNKNDFNYTNVIFGGIDFENQIKKFLKFTQNATAINEQTEISSSLLKYEKKYFSLKELFYPNINYYSLRNDYIFFNVSAGKTAQILSKLTYNQINTKLQFSTQINYDPLLIAITQPQDVKKLIIANSIINPPVKIEDYSLLLNSDIKYNWLNYATDILLNKIYNESLNEDSFYMNDFGVYIFDNQIEYKIKLYQIINHAFKQVK